MKKILYTLLAIATLAGCNKSNGDAKAPKPTELAITAETHNESVGVTMYDTATAAVVGTANTEYTPSASGTNLTSSTPLLYPVSGKVDVEAYYPYRADFDGENYPIELRNSQLVELMISERVAGLEDSETPVKLKFTPCLTAVSVVLTAGEGFTEEALRDNTTVTMVGTKTSGSYNFTTGKVDLADDTTAEISLDTEGMTAHGNVLPQTATATLLFDVEGYGEFTWELDETAFVSGKEATFNITFVNDRVEMTGCTITDWVETAEEVAGNGYVDDLPEPL